MEESGCQLFTLLGAAGVGKSRLVTELLATVHDAATVLQGRCLPYGEGITFWPLLEALPAAGKAAEPAIERLSHGGAATPEELYFEVRRLLESLAQGRPVLLHVDDLQWAEDTLLDLLDHIVDLSRGAPILLLCSARPELLEVRPGWSGGKLNATTLLLEPLAPDDCELLLDQLDDGLAPAARARVIAASDGNPLFLEEMVTLARERGIVTVPSTIQALLAARLESLPSDERDLLERASIEGEVFHIAAVCPLLGDGPNTRVTPTLASLVRKELIRPERAMLDGAEAFRFRHLLIRNAAYDRLPKATRGELHERFGTRLEDDGAELAELHEIAGWHFEQAIRYRHELDRETDPMLERRAAEHLHAAGRRAAARSDLAATKTLLERAHALAPDGEPLQVRIGVDLAEQLIDGHDFIRVSELLSVGEGHPDTAAFAALIRLQWKFFAGDPEARQSVERALPTLIEDLAHAGDERGLARAHLVANLVHMMKGRFKAGAHAARLAAEHASRAGDEGLRARAVGWYVGSLIMGPDHAATFAKKLDVLESEAPGPYVAAFIEHARGDLARMAGRFDEARALKRCAIADFRALGAEWMAADSYHQLAQVELAAGAPSNALAGLLESDAILAALGERGFRSTTQATLAWVYEQLGDLTSARHAIALAQELGGPEGVINYAITHAVRARMALSAGDGDAAEDWARSAVKYAVRMDTPWVRGHAHLELARVLMGVGRDREAVSEARVALNIYEMKGDLPGAAQANALLGELGDST